MTPELHDPSRMIRFNLLSKEPLTVGIPAAYGSLYHRLCHWRSVTIPSTKVTM